MPATLVWGKKFEVRKISEAGAEPFDEVFGIEGGHEMLSWSSVEKLKAIGEQYGVSEESWPVYPDCEQDTEVPLDEAEAKSVVLRKALENIPSVLVENEYWLKVVSGLLRDGNSFFIMI